MKCQVCSGCQYTGDDNCSGRFSGIAANEEIENVRNHAADYSQYSGQNNIIVDERTREECVEGTYNIFYCFSQQNREASINRINYRCFLREPDYLFVDTDSSVI